MAALEIDNAFWRFSLRVYGAPGVAAECLELQDKLGLDVNVVLFAAWLGAEREIVLERSDLDRIEQAVAGWSGSVVLPLRSVRQTLKTIPEIAEPEVQALRKRVAETELFCEQIEQALLYRLAGEIGASASSSAGAARLNIELLLDRRGVSPDGFPLRKLLAACTRPKGQ
jgi:uncharacterized protein (TIGR02444 family)